MCVVADDAQIVHMRIADGKAEGRERERPDVKFTGGEGGNDGRGALKATLLPFCSK